MVVFNYKKFFYNFMKIEVNEANYFKIIEKK